MKIRGANIVSSGIKQSPAQEFIYQGSLTTALTTAVGGVLSLLNDTGVDILVTDAIVCITTAADGANTINIGVDDLGDTDNNLLLDALAANATGVFDNRIDKGTAGGMTVWKNGEYIVGTASATLVGMVATYVIKGVAI